MNSNEKYCEKIDKAKAAIKVDISNVHQFKNGSAQFNNAYHLAEANLRHFFPELDQIKCEQIIADIFLHQHMAMYDQSDFSLVDETILDDKAHIFNSEKSNHGRIFCTYHLGSYRQVFHFLAKAGIDCLLLIASKTLREQGESFIQESKKLEASCGWTGKLTVIDAEDRNSLLYCLRALKKGVSVVVFIDGNVGVGKNNSRKDLTNVNFFGKEILARNGIAYLSHLSGASIIPVTSKRVVENRLKLTTHQSINPEQTLREEYVTTTTNALYALLEKEISDRLGQWEGWLYVEKFIKKGAELGMKHSDNEIIHVDVRSSLSTNINRFALLVYSEQFVLLDKAKHSFFMLDESSVNIFRSGINGYIDLNTYALHSTKVQQLIKLGALKSQ